MNYHEKILKAQGVLELQTIQKDSAEKELNRLIQLSEDIEFVQVFFQQVAQETQDHLIIHIKDIVQMALDSCFPDEYEFAINFEMKRGKTEANIYFIKNGVAVNPLDSSGGGAVDVLCFGLRLACWTLSKTDNVIILDEPFRFLSKDLQPKAGEIMKKLSEELGLQFIVVSHNESIIDSADRVFEVKLKKGRSIVRCYDKEAS